MHRHTPQAGRALKDLARLPRVQRAVVAKKLQKGAGARWVRRGWKLHLNLNCCLAVLSCTLRTLALTPSFTRRPSRFHSK